MSDNNIRQFHFLADRHGAQSDIKKIKSYMLMLQKQPNVLSPYNYNGTFWNLHIIPAFKAVTRTQSSKSDRRL